MTPTHEHVRHVAPLPVGWRLVVYEPPPPPPPDKDVCVYLNGVAEPVIIEFDNPEKLIIESASRPEYYEYPMAVLAHVEVWDCDYETFPIPRHPPRECRREAQEDIRQEWRAISTYSDRGTPFPDAFDEDPPVCYRGPGQIVDDGLLATLRNEHKSNLRHAAWLREYQEQKAKQGHEQPH